MSWRLARLALVSLALALPLGGCLEPLGHPSYNHGPSTSG